MTTPQDSPTPNAPKASSKKWPILAGLAIVGLPLLGWLAFGFFGIQAAFIDNEVSESADGLFDTATATEEEVAEETEPVEEEAVEEEAVEEAPAEEVAEEPVEDAVEEAPAEEAVEEEPVEEEAVEEEAVEEAPAEEVVEEEPAEEAQEPGEIVTIASGNFGSLNGYSVTGDALVLNNGTEQRFLRFENFVSDNGPDLKVYLRAASGEFVSLGDLSGNIGDQNYEIPVDVDLSVFNTVEIWCERFSSGFGAATLA